MIFYRFLLLAFGLLLVVGCQKETGTASSVTGAAAAPPPLPTLDPDGIVLGKAVYEVHCASCHGINLEGEPDWQQPNEDGSFRAPPHDASGHTWHHDDNTLREAILLGGSRLPDNIGGTSNMPAYQGMLTPGEISAVLMYIKSTWPENIRQTQWERTVLSNEQ